MHKFLLPFIISFLYLSVGFAQNWDGYAVLFGEKEAQLSKAPSHVIRIFLDQEGTVYPNYYISDSKLRKANNRLSSYFRTHPKDLKNICLQSNLDTVLVDTLAKIKLINEVLLNQLVDSINTQQKEYDRVFFLIHGYRKKAYGNASFLSVRDNQYLRNNISKNQKKNLFVEIYWDSKYITALQSYKYNGFKLMEYGAIPNAQKVGQVLRQILPQIKVDTLNIVAHSLGAVVAAELLFNTKKQSLPTPSQKVVNVCFMAPAIGSEYFKDFHKRNTALDFKKEDNYHLYIIHNQNDFVLNKTFEWGIFKVSVEPTEYGNTSLGCNYKDDVQRLIKLFERKFPNSKLPEFIEIKEYDGGYPMQCHLIYCYSGHSKFFKIPMMVE